MGIFVIEISTFIEVVDKLRIMPVIDGGKSLIQPVNTRDLGKAVFTVLMSPDTTDGKAYNLSGERPINMIDGSKELNKKTVYISVPLGLGVLMAKSP